MLSFHLSISGLNELEDQFDGFPEAIEEEIYSAVLEATQLVHARAIENIGEMFKTSGKMANAVEAVVSRLSPGVVIGEIWVSGIGYVVQELGGTHPYFIYPMDRRALRFVGSAGDAIFRPEANRQPLPERSFLRLALEQERDEIHALFEGIGLRSWERAEVRR